MEINNHKRYSLKVVLHAHPHFYGINNVSGTVSEKVYRFARPVPSLSKIVEYFFSRKIGLGVISSCHTKTSGIDSRFSGYLFQINTLHKDYEIQYDKKRGILEILKKDSEESQNKLLILHSQEVRTEENGALADINIIGVGRNIQAGLTPKETAKIAREEGGIVSICHPASPYCSLGIENTLKMIYHNMADSYEIHNSQESREVNEKMHRVGEEWMEMYGIKSGISVSDSHYYKDADKAHILMKEDILEGFSIEKLKLRILNGEFRPVFGNTSLLSKHLNHTLPIVLSIPEHLIRNPEEIEKTFPFLRRFI